MIDEEAYNKALDFAEKKHKGQFRIGGAPYITHPVAVADILKRQGYGTDYRIAGLFHDLLEDTDATEKELLSLGNEEILHAVKLVTKEKGYDMEDYIKRIKADKMALAVKKADRLHNLMCAVAADENFKRKYIMESVKWYGDFSPEILKAVKELAETLDAPIPELEVLYENPQ